MEQYRVTWEMRVWAESKDEAEARMAEFASRADMLGREPAYCDFDISSLKRSEVEHFPAGGTWSGTGDADDFVVR
jgi:hypothetical protein